MSRISEPCMPAQASIGGGLGGRAGAPAHRRRADPDAEGEHSRPSNVGLERSAPPPPAPSASWTTPREESNLEGTKRRGWRRDAGPLGSMEATADRDSCGWEAPRERERKAPGTPGAEGVVLVLAVELCVSRSRAREARAENVRSSSWSPVGVGARQMAKSGHFSPRLGAEVAAPPTRGEVPSFSRSRAGIAY